MTTNEPSGQEFTDASATHHRDTAAVEKRITRALDSFFHVEPANDGDYTVFSGSGNTYTVDPSDGSCTCPDGQRGPWCKHAHRVAFVTGELPDIDGVHVAVSGEETDGTETDDDADSSDDAPDTLAERVERFEQANPGASAIEAISQLGIDPSQKKRVEEVLA
jgi:hypothetical protein